jgi:hypothetical protein
VGATDRRYPGSTARLPFDSECDIVGAAAAADDEARPRRSKTDRMAQDPTAHAVAQKFLQVHPFKRPAGGRPIETDTAEGTADGLRQSQTLVVIPQGMREEDPDLRPWLATQGQWFEHALKVHRALMGVFRRGDIDFLETRIREIVHPKSVNHWSRTIEFASADNLPEAHCFNIAARPDIRDYLRNVPATNWTDKHGREPDKGR